MSFIDQFDKSPHRSGTQCEKFDGASKRFGSSEIIPLWVADMDFAVAPAITEAIQARVQHPVFGYTFPSESLKDAMFSWYQQRHQWQINPANTLFAPGVVPSLAAIIRALTNVDDGIIVPTPVYPPFFSVVTNNQRQLLTSPLVENQGHYQFDFEHIEKLAQQGAKALMLCNPHNPVGRVWQASELSKLIDIATRYHLLMISDDIHCDLVLNQNTYTPIAKLAPTELRWLTCVSPSKTFNIPGLNLSAVVTSHSQDKTLIKAELNRTHVNPYNPLTLAAFEAAYRHGAPWLDALLRYLENNCAWLEQACEEIEGITFNQPEATCLVWLDCRQLGFNDDQLKHFFIHQAKLGLNEGISFGPGGSGFMRLNIGTQQQRLQQALEQLKSALQAS